MDRTVKNIFKNSYEKGISLLESLVATAIVGIGFVAVFQIVNYSTQSINVSSERTKMNYIVSMVAEDLIGYGNSLVNVNPKTTQVQLDEYRRPVENGVISSVKKYPQNFVGNEYKISACDDNNEKFKKFSENPEIYDNDPDKSAAHNKTYRIQKILSEDVYLKCVQQNSVDATGASLSSTQDIKSIEVFKICNDSSIGCTTGTTTDFIFDETYIGRVQISTNNGRKKKTLYFQADYIFKDYSGS